MGAFFPIEPDSPTLQQVSIIPTIYKTLLDEASSSITYVGKAVPASATSAAVWQISKLTTSAGDLSVEYADGGDFSQIWDDRASLSYS